MKNASLLIIACFLAISSAVAQQGENDYQRFRLGFELDPNVSWFNPKSNDVESAGAVARIGGGVNVDVFFQKNYAFGTGFYIRSRGGKLNYLSTFNDVANNELIASLERTYNSKFIEIPLTFKLKTDEIGRIRYYGQFGLGLGFDIGAKGDEFYSFQQVYDSNANAWVEARATEFPGFNEEDIDFNDQVAALRTSMIIAAGAEIAMTGTTAIKVGLTFNNGFTNALTVDTRALKTAKGTDDILFTDQEIDGVSKPVPQTTDLKVVSNSLALNIGILF